MYIVISDAPGTQNRCRLNGLTAILINDKKAVFNMPLKPIEFTALLAIMP